MKTVVSPPYRGPLIVYRVIFLLLLAVVGLLAAGTIFGIVRGSGAKPLFRLGGGQSGSAAKSRPAGAEDGPVSVFTGIGRLRIPLPGKAPGKDTPGAATLILSLAFPYPSGDQAFTEELAVKVAEFRTIAVDYFSSLPLEKLTNLNEDAAKAEILKRWNANLRLGKIEALYFSDLMVIE